MRHKYLHRADATEWSVQRMNVLEKILEEIKEAFDENIDDIEDSAGIHHFAIDSFTAWYIARKIIRSHMDEEKDDGWISVKKRLPEGKEVIAQNKDGEMLIGYVYYSEEMEWYECESESMYLTNVIAWQPLPKPYKEK